MKSDPAAGNSRRGVLGCEVLSMNRATRKTVLWWAGRVVMALVGLGLLVLAHAWVML